MEAALCFVISERTSSHEMCKYGTSRSPASPEGEEEQAGEVKRHLFYLWQAEMWSALVGTGTKLEPRVSS